MHPKTAWRRQVRDPVVTLARSRRLEALPRRYGDRISPVTRYIARRWGRLSAGIGHGGADRLVAATAVRHVAPTGVAGFDPFKAA